MIIAKEARLGDYLQMQNLYSSKQQHYWMPEDYELRTEYKSASFKWWYVSRIDFILIHREDNASANLVEMRIFEAGIVSPLNQP